MFPVWSHWSVKYTPKGIWKQRVRFVLGRLLLLAAVIAVFWLRRPGSLPGLVGVFLAAVKWVAAAAQRSLHRSRDLLQPMS